jgi:hypothetical protein
MDFKDCLTADDLEKKTKSPGFKKNFAAFEEAKNRGFVTFQNRNWDLANAYYRWCEIMGMPYLRVQLFRRYAHVELDLISFRYTYLDYGLSEEGVNHVAALIKREYEFIKSNNHYKISKKDIYWGRSYADIERLPLERVDDYVKNLLEILANHLECSGK